MSKTSCKESIQKLIDELVADGADRMHVLNALTESVLEFMRGLRDGSKPFS